MNDSLRMRGIQCVGDLHAEVDNRFDLHRLAHDYVTERLTFQKFHCNESATVSIVDFVDRANIRMVECRCGLGLALESAERLRVIGQFVGKKLQGDHPSELRVFRLVDNTHPSATEFLNDAVVRDGLADKLG